MTTMTLVSTPQTYQLSLVDYMCLFGLLLIAFRNPVLRLKPERLQPDPPLGTSANFKPAGDK